MKYTNIMERLKGKRWVLYVLTQEELASYVKHDPLQCWTTIKTNQFVLHLAIFQKNVFVWTHGQMSENVSENSTGKCCCTQEGCIVAHQCREPFIVNSISFRNSFLCCCVKFKGNLGEGVVYDGRRGKIWEKKEAKNKTELVIK